MNRTETARLGGIARAAKLSPARRREIAALGFAGLVEKRFGGDRQAAIDWLTRKGLAALDSDFPTPMRKFFDPGPMPPAEPRPDRLIPGIDLFGGLCKKPRLAGHGRIT